MIEVRYRDVKKRPKEKYGVDIKNSILKFVVVYLDDIVIYSDTLEEHVVHLKKVFKILRENQLYVKREKCEFAQPKVHFLGHIISQGELRMDEAKKKAIQEWEAPMKVAELRSFLGLANYYRRFISGYSAKATPLTELLKKNKPWVWSQECREHSKDLTLIFLPYKLQVKMMWWFDGGQKGYLLKKNLH
uniref:Reverse transcriptase domain-containing protein n=1 Tax=Solanum lycopersicum TaxID=4081 RepID=A0A3Q7EZB1_SOLLC